MVLLTKIYSFVICKCVSTSALRITCKFQMSFRLEKPPIRQHKWNTHFIQKLQFFSSTENIYMWTRNGWHFLCIVLNARINLLVFHIFESGHLFIIRWWNGQSGVRKMENRIMWNFYCICDKICMRNATEQVLNKVGNFVLYICKIIYTHNTFA